MERNMEMSQKYIMQSHKWHTAEQRGNVLLWAAGDDSPPAAQERRREGFRARPNTCSLPPATSCFPSRLSPKPPLIWAFPGVCFWGHASIISYKCNLQHLLLSQPSEPSERENTGYWEAHGCLCGIYLSSITHKDLWDTSSIQWLRNQSQRKLQWLYLTPAPEIFSSPLTTQLHVLLAELMSFSVCPDLWTENGKWEKTGSCWLQEIQEETK